MHIDRYKNPKYKEYINNLNLINVNNDNSASQSPEPDTNESNSSFQQITFEMVSDMIKRKNAQLDVKNLKKYVNTQD